MVSYLNTSGAVLDGEQLGRHANHQMTICRLKKEIMAFERYARADSE